MVSPSEDEIYEVYASHQTDSKIEYEGEIIQYLVMEMYRWPDGSIHLKQTYLTKSILNIIPDMEKSSNKTNPAGMRNLNK